MTPSVHTSAPPSSKKRPRHPLPPPMPSGADNNNDNAVIEMMYCQATTPPAAATTADIIGPPPKSATTQKKSSIIHGARNKRGRRRPIPPPSTTGFPGSGGDDDVFCSPCGLAAPPAPPKTGTLPPPMIGAEYPYATVIPTTTTTPPPKPPPPPQICDNNIGGGMVCLPCGHPDATIIYSTPPPPPQIENSRQNNNGTTKGSDDDEPVIVQSVFAVQGVCCTSEVPSVRRIVKASSISAGGGIPPVEVKSIQINIATKRVYVRHTVVGSSDDAANNFALIAAEQLSQQGFPARVVRNGADAISIGNNSIANANTKFSAYVETTLSVPSLSDAPAAAVQSLEQQLCHPPAPHRPRALRAVTAGVIKIEHIPAHLSTPKLVQLLQSKIGEQQNQYNKFKYDDYSETDESEDDSSVSSSNNLRAPRLPVVTVITDGQAEQLFLPETTTAGEDAAGAPLDSENSASLHWYIWISGIFWVLSSIGGILRNDLEYAGIVSVLFGLPSVALKAFRTIRRCEFDANCMMVTAAIGSVFLGEWDEAASVSFLFCVSEFLEHKATHRARRALAEILRLRPEHAYVVPDADSSQVTIVPAEQVPVGSFLKVRTGDKIAADGVVVHGTSTVDESSLTGESLPVRKAQNDTVAGGTINVGTSPLTVRTTCKVEDSAVSRLIRLVEEASANVSPTEKMVDAFARAYTPAVLGAAILMCSVPWVLWGAAAGREWMLNGLILIVVACPCALTISTPVTYAAGLAATAQRGVVVKGGSSLEALGNATRVVLDKTGTLTKGQFSVVNLREIGDAYRRKEMLGLLALIESPSSHPLSATLVKAAQQEGVEVPTQRRLEDHTVLQGEGVSANVDGKQMYVGNRRLFQRLGLMQKLHRDYVAMAEEWDRSGGTVGFIGSEDKGIFGAFCLSDTIREDAEEAVCALQASGVDVVMLTGDSREAAHSVAREVGLPEEAVHAQLTPEDKLHLVGSFKRPPPKTCVQFLNRNSRVVFCGDGINDCPSMAVADVGIAMGEGASLALEMSDVTLMDSSLNKLLYVIQMGGRVVQTIKQNIALSLICKLVVVGLTFCGKMTLFYAIASDVGVMLLVTLNGMKLLPRHHEVRMKRRRRRRMNPRKRQSPKEEMVALARSKKTSEIDAELV